MHHPVKVGKINYTGGVGVVNLCCQIVYEHDYLSTILVNGDRFTMESKTIEGIPQKNIIRDPTILLKLKHDFI